MKFPRLTNCSKLQNVNISEYLVDWNKTKGVSKPQLKVQNFLKPYWISHTILTELRIPGSLLRIDIINVTLSIAIEISPAATHSDYNEFFHQSRAGFLTSIKRDIKKREYVEECLKWKFIELNDEDIDNLSKDLFEKKFEVYL